MKFTNILFILFIISCVRSMTGKEFLNSLNSKELNQCGFDINVTEGDQKMSILNYLLDFKIETYDDKKEIQNLHDAYTYKVIEVYNKKGQDYFQNKVYKMTPEIKKEIKETYNLCFDFIKNLYKFRNLRFAHYFLQNQIKENKLDIKFFEKYFKYLLDNQFLGNDEKLDNSLGLILLNYQKRYTNLNEDMYEYLIKNHKLSILKQTGQTSGGLTKIYSEKLKGFFENISFSEDQKSDGIVYSLLIQDYLAITQDYQFFDKFSPQDQKTILINLLNINYSSELHLNLLKDLLLQSEDQEFFNNFVFNLARFRLNYPTQDSFNQEFRKKLLIFLNLHYKGEYKFSVELYIQNQLGQFYDEQDQFLLNLEKMTQKDKDLLSQETEMSQTLFEVLKNIYILLLEKNTVLDSFNKQGLVNLNQEQQNSVFEKVSNKEIQNEEKFEVDESIRSVLHKFNNNQMYLI